MPEMELKVLIVSGEPAYDEITAGAVPRPGQLKSESRRRKLAVEDGSTRHHDTDWAASILHSHIIDDNPPPENNEPYSAHSCRIQRARSDATWPPRRPAL